MSKAAVRFALVDAFTNEAFKGNPAAVVLFQANADVDEHWMQSIAKEFNVSDTAFVSDVLPATDDERNWIPRFNIRWFTPAAEVKLCGHATLATAHYLFEAALKTHDTIEFVSKSGLLVARRITKPEFTLKEEDKFTVELDFPADPVVECDASEFPSIPLTLNARPIANVMKTTACGDLIVELTSGKEVAELQPNFKEIEECAGRGVIVTGPAPDGSGFDFFTRFFCPKLGINEDPVCGSVHCALVPYWSEKLKKKSLTAFMASPRTGVLHLELDEKSQRVRISGEAVTVTVGTLLV